MILRQAQDRRFKFAFAACAMFLFALCPFAEAQQAKKVPRVGFLSSSTLPSMKVRIEAFRDGLRELGYVEGKTIVVEYRSAEGKLDRLPALAKEFVALKVDVIVSPGASATRAIKQATATIPVVMTQDPDPVGNGFVANLGHPGGNITGLSSMAADLAGKRLELLKEILPKLSRVAIFETSTNTGNARQLRETEIAAETLGVKLQRLDIRSANDVEAAYGAAVKERADAVFVLTSSITDSDTKHIAELAVKNRLPMMHARADAVEAGGLMSYGVSLNDLHRRAAVYVDKILKGAKPADLPIEQPTKFELVINLKTAKQIGLTIPPNVLARADRVIK
jgi:putative tryptophan/tyrosine transport system substrate-binding protein